MSAALVIASMATADGAAPVQTVSATAAYSEVRERGVLEKVIITDSFDLSEISKDGKAVKLPSLTFTEVRFAGGLTAENATVAADIYFRKCQFSEIFAEKATWLGSVTFEGGGTEGLANFQENDFKSTAKFYNIEFNDETSFAKSRFSRATEFIRNSWWEKVRFSDVVFSGTVKFIRSTVHGRAVFHAALFKEDASFIEFAVDDIGGVADLENCVFKGDVEFRYCSLETARFSSRKHMTVFYKLADFRGSTIQSALFEYAEARGIVNFVKAKFGAGGVSFRAAVFSGPLVNMDSIECEGPIILEDAYMPTVQFHWNELKKGVLNGLHKTSPDKGEYKGSRLFDWLERRLETLGRGRDALAVRYERYVHLFREILTDPERTLLEKAWAGLEWILWGWPTQYGTNLGRILSIAALCWIFSLLSVFGSKGLLARLPPRRHIKDGSEGVWARRYEATLWFELPAGTVSPVNLFDRLRVAAVFCFGLLFKVGGGRTIYVERELRWGRYGFETYFLCLWGLGTGLLALMAVTLANTSPLFSTIIQKVFS